MDRGEFLRKAGQITLGSILTATTPLPGCLASLWETRPVKPNILIIYTDDQHYHSLEEMAGSPLDPLSKTKARFSTGVKFENSYCETPVCAPSRTSFMRGQTVTNHGMDSNYRASWRFRNRGYARDSLGNWMKEVGYTTSYVGKYLNGYREVAAWTPPGFDNWISTLGTPDPVRWNRNGIVRKSIHARKDETQVLADQTAEFIQGATEPYFAVCAFNSPHVPIDPSNANKGTYNGVTFPARPNFDHLDTNKPKFVQAPPLTSTEKTENAIHWRGVMEELQDVDDAVDSLLSVVDFTDTYVFFTSDNGDLFGAHRLRETKGYPYEESTKVPLLAVGPGMLEGVTSDVLVSNIDLAPTCLELAGIDAVEKSCDGRSLVAPLFDDAMDSATWRQALYMECHDTRSFEDMPQWWALRTPGASYIEWGTGDVEYYDMVADPYQLTNIASETDPVTLYEMNTQLATLRSSCGEDLRSAEVSTV